MVAIALVFFTTTQICSKCHIAQRRLELAIAIKTYEHILQHDYVMTTHTSHPTMCIQNMVDYVAHNAMCVLHDEIHPNFPTQCSLSLPNQPSNQPPTNMVYFLPTTCSCHVTIYLFDNYPVITRNVTYNRIATPNREEL
jgi:hypothetical protein